MRKMLLSGLALVAFFVGPAMAADIPVKAPVFKALPPPVAYNWTGIFTGSSVGVQSWDISGIYVQTPDAHHTQATKGVYGSHIGGQYQINSWVLGVEAAFNSPFNRSYSSAISPSDNCQGFTPVLDRRCSSRIDSTWTVGGRLGYAVDRTLFFGTGGYASGRVDTTTNVNSTGLLATSTQVRQNGWFAGGGAEYFVTKFLWSDLILGAEYQHIDLGTSRHVDTITNLPVNTRDVKATEDIARARMIFKWTP
jgi:outer membrane immunogenic protein